MNPTTTSGGVMPPLITEPHTDVVEFLAVNGYFAGDFPDAGALDDTDPVYQRAIIAWQELAGIVPDGVFGPVSSNRASHKRCALPDNNRGFQWDALQSGYVEWSIESACTRGWSTKSLTCAHNAMSFSTLSAAETDAAWWRSKMNWMAVCGVTFERVAWNGPRSANFYHDKKSMGGRGGKLAHHYLPNCGSGANTTLEGMFDTGERWTPSMFEGVCGHEDGHGLGLSHSDDPKDLLYPYYNGRIIKPTAGDVRRVVSRYGPPKRVTPTDPTEPQTLAERVLRLELSNAVNTAIIEKLLEDRL